MFNSFFFFLRRVWELYLDIRQHGRYADTKIPTEVKGFYIVFIINNKPYQQQPFSILKSTKKLNNMVLQNRPLDLLNLVCVLLLKLFSKKKSSFFAVVSMTWNFIILYYGLIPINWAFSLRLMQQYLGYNEE